MTGEPLVCAAQVRRVLAPTAEGPGPRARVGGREARGAWRPRDTHPSAGSRPVPAERLPRPLSSQRETETRGLPGARTGASRGKGPPAAPPAASALLARYCSCAACRSRGDVGSHAWAWPFPGKKSHGRPGSADPRPWPSLTTQPAAPRPPRLPGAGSCPWLPAALGVCVCVIVCLCECMSECV